MKKKIAIQGFEGSFHQSAALKYYGKEVEVICCSTFREVVKVAGDSSRSDGGLMAIENSIAGSIHSDSTQTIVRQLRHHLQMAKIEKA